MRKSRGLKQAISNAGNMWPYPGYPSSQQAHITGSFLECVLSNHYLVFWKCPLHMEYHGISHCYSPDFFFLILGCCLTILIVRICVELVSCCKSKPPGHRYQGCAIGRAEARSQLESAGSSSLPDSMRMQLVCIHLLGWSRVWELRKEQWRPP